jgi:asparagine synthase (glutamine-hydrolysing)
VRAERLTYLTEQKLLRLEQELARVLAADVPGDILEFGVALGGSAIVLATHCQPRNFHGFDVFGMIPEPTSDKDDSKSKERFRVIQSGQSKGLGGDRYYGYRENLFEDVKASFRRHGTSVDGKRVTLHKGLFQDTWSAYSGSQIAFAHLDCDWYDPVEFCLSAVAERLSVGGALLLDDYHDYGGCKSATDEFLAAHPEFAFRDGPNVLLEKKS